MQISLNEWPSMRAELKTHIEQMKSMELELANAFTGRLSVPARTKAVGDILNKYDFE